MFKKNIMNEYITVPTILTAVGAILVTIGAFWSSIENARNSKASDIKRSEYQNELCQHELFYSLLVVIFLETLQILW